MKDYILNCIKLYFLPLVKIKGFARHCYYAIRYGDWDIGWDKEWLTKEYHKWFVLGHAYYDGNHVCLRISKFYIYVGY